MSLQLNRAQIAGNLTRDPQLRFLANDRAVASVGVAINESWTDKEGVKQKRTTFIEVQAFGSTADFLGKFFVKGSPIYIEGCHHLDQWTDKEGKKQSRLIVTAQLIKFVESKANGETVEEVDESTGVVTRRTVHKAAGKGGAT